MVGVDLANLHWGLIAAATVAGILFGMVWYSPVLFGSQWMRAMKISKKDIIKDKSSWPYAEAAFAHFVLAVVVAELVYMFGAFTLWEGVQVGLITGVGIAAALQMVHASFKGNRVLALINSAYDVMVVVLMAGMMAFWR